MKKTIAILAALMLLILLSSCDETTKEPGSEETTSAKTTSEETMSAEITSEETTLEETTSEQTTEEEMIIYPDVVELETDLAEVDYSKFFFASEPVYIDSDKELSIHDYSDARQLLKAAEAHNGELVSASSYDEALSLLSQVIECSGDNKYKLMVAVSFTGVQGGYYVSTRYSEMYNMYPNTGERQDLLFFSERNIDYVTIDGFLRAWERFTKYSSTISITFYTVPVVNVTE